jgi:hypothetical protein
MCFDAVGQGGVYYYYYYHYYIIIITIAKTGRMMGVCFSR